MLGCVAVFVPLVIRVRKAKRARAATEQTYWRLWTILCLSLAWPMTVSATAWIMFLIIVVAALVNLMLARRIRRS